MLKVFKLNQADWWLAETVEQGVEACCKYYELPQDECIDIEPFEVPDADLDRLTLTDEDGTKKTFREALKDMNLESGYPSVFASTELP